MNSGLDNYNPTPEQVLWCTDCGEPINACVDTFCWNCGSLQIDRPRGAKVPKLKWVVEGYECSCRKRRVKNPNRLSTTRKGLWLFSKTITITRLPNFCLACGTLLNPADVPVKPLTEEEAMREERNFAYLLVDPKLSTHPEDVGFDSEEQSNPLPLPIRSLSGDRLTRLQQTRN